MQTGSWPSRAYGATPNRVVQRAYIGQWPPISEQIIREGQHTPPKKHTGRYGVRRYLNVCTRMAHTTCNVRSLVAVRGKADVRVKDRVRPISEVGSWQAPPNTLSSGPRKGVDGRQRPSPDFIACVHEQIKFQ